MMIANNKNPQNLSNMYEQHELLLGIFHIIYGWQRSNI